MSDFRIYIPTAGRADKQMTLKFIQETSQDLLDRTVLVVPVNEIGTYADLHGMEVDIIGCPEKGIANTRQWIVENSQSNLLFQLDDDMVFFKREELGTKLARCTTEEFEHLFNELCDWLKEYPLVGVSARQGNNHVEEDFRTATRQMNFHGINRQYFLDNNIKMNSLQVMEDFHTVLSLLTSGVANKVMYDYCWNQRGSGADGGCSTYRDNDLQSDCATDLAMEFPDFVTTVIKKSKSSWQGMQERTDVRVQWKKAYQWGLENA